jgi:hypothetical protein
MNGQSARVRHAKGDAVSPMKTRLITLVHVTKIAPCLEIAVGTTMQSVNIPICHLSFTTMESWTFLSV